MNPAISIKPRPCKVCRLPFIRSKRMQRVCSVECSFQIPVIAAEKAARKAALADRKQTRAKLEAMRTAKQWLPLAQEAFNKWIRWRDRDQPCICCGKPFEPDKLGGSVDAGHYLSRSQAPHLRFDERNVFAQRKNCNMPGGTTRAAFRAGVVARIGLTAVEALEADQTPKRYRADDLKAIRDEYRARLKSDSSNA